MDCDDPPARSPDDDGHNVQCCGTSFYSPSAPQNLKLNTVERGSEIENVSTVSEERGVSAVITRSI